MTQRDRAEEERIEAQAEIIRLLLPFVPRPDAIDEGKSNNGVAVDDGTGCAPSISETAKFGVEEVVALTWPAAVEQLLKTDRRTYGTPASLLNCVSVPATVRSVIVRTSEGLAVASWSDGAGAFEAQHGLPRIGTSRTKMSRAARFTSIAPEGAIAIELEGDDIVIRVCNPAEADFSTLMAECWTSDDDCAHYHRIDFEPRVEIPGHIEVRVTGAARLALVLAICDRRS